MILSLITILFWTEIFILHGIGVLSESLRCEKVYNGEIINVTINTTVNDKGEYVFYKNCTYKVGIVFRAGQDSTDCTLDFKTTLSLFGDAMSSDVPFLLSFTQAPGVGFNSNCCQNHNVTCPLEANKIYYYTTDLKINTYFPAMSFVIRTDIMSGKDQYIACQNIKIKITGSD